MLLDILIDYIEDDVEDFIKYLIEVEGLESFMKIKTDNKRVEDLKSIAREYCEENNLCPICGAELEYIKDRSADEICPEEGHMSCPNHGEVE
jgi:hypothetical protein